jgi:hypothetical protein
VKAKERKEAAAQEFERWSTMKTLVDTAQTCLDALPSPAGSDVESGTPLCPSLQLPLPLRSSLQLFTSALRCTVSIPSERLWRSVGRALKRVERGLLSQWIKWTAGAFPASQCLVEWDSFSPISCDTHAPSSDVRSMFLKLLHRRKVDFKKAFAEASASLASSRTTPGVRAVGCLFLALALTLTLTLALALALALALTHCGGLRVPPVPTHEL